MTQHTPAMPRRRTTQLAVRTVGDETLVYDESADRAHSLPAGLTAIWDRCDGSTAIDDVAVALGIDDTAINDGLLQLADADLVEAVGDSRRRFLARAALVGGGAVAFPLLTSIAGPKAFAAASTDTTYDLLSVTSADTGLTGAVYDFQYVAATATPTGAVQLPNYGNGTTGDNAGGFPQRYGSENVYTDPISGAMSYFPYGGPDTANGYAHVQPSGAHDLVIQFKPPAAGSLTGSFTFTALQSGGGNGLDVSVYVDGTVSGPTSIIAAGPATATFSIPATTITTASEIYLVVSAKGENSYDGTSVSGSFTIHTFSS